MMLGKSMSRITSTLCGLLKKNLTNRAPFIRVMIKREETSSESEKEANNMLEKYADHLWFAYLNLCIICVRTRKEPLAKLGCACLRYYIAIDTASLELRVACVFNLGRWSTSK